MIEAYDSDKIETKVSISDSSFKSLHRPSSMTSVVDITPLNDLDERPNRVSEQPSAMKQLESEHRALSGSNLCGFCDIRACFLRLINRILPSKQTTRDETTLVGISKAGCAIETQETSATSDSSETKNEQKKRLSGKVKQSSDVVYGEKNNISPETKQGELTSSSGESYQSSSTPWKPKNSVNTSKPWHPSQSVLALKSDGWIEGFKCITEGDIEGLKVYAGNKGFQSALNVWRNQSGENILHILCRRGVDVILKVILERLPNNWLVNSSRTRETGMLPLHSAAAGGYVRCVLLLIELGKAEVRDQFDCYGLTPLHRTAICTSRGSDECAEVLLKAGSDLLVADHTGQSAWHKAVFHGNLPVILVFEKYVIENGLTKELLDNDRNSAVGKSSLHLAAKFATKDHGRAAEKIIMLLARHLRFDVNIRSSVDGYTPLHDAAVAGNVGAVKALLATGADPNARLPGELMTPLHLAVSANNPAVVRLLLLDKSTQVDIVDANGNTPRRSAFYQNHFDIANIFLDVSINKKDRKRRKKNSVSSAL